MKLLLELIGALVKAVATDLFPSTFSGIIEKPLRIKTVLIHEQRTR